MILLLLLLSVIQFTLSITARLFWQKKAVIERDRYREFADHSHVINYNGDTI
jgi:hypothetical protein